MFTTEFGTLSQIDSLTSVISTVILTFCICFLFIAILSVVMKTCSINIISILILIISLAGIFLKTSENHKYKQSCENVKTAIEENYKKIDTISDINKKDLKGHFNLKDSDETYRFRVEDNVLHIYCIEDDTKNKDIPGEIY